MNAVGLGGIKPSIALEPPAPASPEKEQGSFGDLLSDAMGRVNQLQSEADGELRKLLAGEPVELHRVLLASEKAGLASQLMMSIRNKAVDAYQEVMRMQV